MTFTLNKRRVLLALFLAGAIAFIIVSLARLALTEMAVGSLLRMAGASEVKFNVAQASPWRVVFEDIGFQLKTQLFEAKRVSVARRHWWSPSLGVVRLEAVRIPLTIDGSDYEPASYKNSAAVQTPSHLPVEEVHVDGQVIIRAMDVPDQALTIKLSAQLTGVNQWAGNITVDAPGLAVQGDIGYDLGKDQVTFKLPEIALDLKPWEGFVHRLIVLPGGTWEMEGKFHGHAEGSLVGKALSASGAVHLREGRVRYDAKDITAAGIEADLEFIDFDRMLTKPGSVRIAEINAAGFQLRDVRAEVALAGSEKVIVSSLSLLTLGGKASLEPFNYFPNLREIEAVVLVDGFSVEEIMALTKDLPAKASGRVNGRFPIRFDDSGIRLGTGWLELKSGVYAELQLHADGLLTGGMSEKSSSYAVLKRVESGLLKLKISELRLDIRPPNAPAGRSAQLRISGSPVDTSVKAPVTLDLNVNGPLEQLLNLGLDSRISFGGKP